jgi:sodium pump decarboxylase gamma subunit
MEILLQGLVLLASGMGIVFSFLSLLVWVMNRSAQIVPKFNHVLPDDEPKKKTRPAAAHAHHGHDDVHVAVAIAAAMAHAR